MKWERDPPWKSWERCSQLPPPPHYTTDKKSPVSLSLRHSYEISDPPIIYLPPFSTLLLQRALPSAPSIPLLPRSHSLLLSRSSRNPVIECLQPFLIASRLPFRLRHRCSRFRPWILRPNCSV